MQDQIVVLGGSSGMGFSIAKLMSSLGYPVLIASRSEHKLTKAAHEIQGAETHILDVCDEKAVQSFFAEIKPFSHLVLSAADFVMGPFRDLETKEARRFFDSKFWGQYTAIKYAAAKIKQNGSITLFSGIASEKPTKGLSVASAINGAIEGLTRALAIELAPLRINAISPGIIETPVWNEMPEKERQAFFQKAGSKLPVGKIGQPEEIAQAARFLIECPFVTGEILHCDGGGRFI